MKRQKLGVRRLVAGVTAAVLGVAGLLIEASPAFAVGECNTGWTEGHWTTTKSYTYAPGRWCILSSQSAVSATLVFQTDGNLVWYVGSHPLWSTSTFNKGATRLVFQTDSNIVIYAGTKVLWASGRSASRTSSSQFYLVHGLDSNDPNRVYELDAWQESPNETYFSKVVTYNG